MTRVNSIGGSRNVTTTKDEIRELDWARGRQPQRYAGFMDLLLSHDQNDAA
jgi:hypothetical protein